MKTLSLITITFVILLSACKSNEKRVLDMTCGSCEDALIRYFGDPAADGCGWVVEASSVIYMPQNLLPEFYIDSLEVQI